MTRELHWDPDDAKDVIKLIDKLNSGGHFQGGQKTDLKRHIKRWSEKNNTAANKWFCNNGRNCKVQQQFFSNF